MKWEKKKWGPDKKSYISYPTQRKCVNRCLDLHECLLHNDLGADSGLNESCLPLRSWIPSFTAAGRRIIRHNFVFCRKPCTSLQAVMDCAWSHFLEFLSTKSSTPCLPATLKINHVPPKKEQATQTSSQLPSKQVNHFTKVQYCNTQTELTLLLTKCCTHCS